MNLVPFRKENEMKKKTNKLINCFPSVLFVVMLSFHSEIPFVMHLCFNFDLNTESKFSRNKAIDF